MCIALEILDAVHENIEAARNEAYRLRQELSTTDKTISDLLHELEFSKSFSASQGYKYAKMLKTLREDRRYIKNELEELQVFLEKFIDFNIYKLRRSLLDLEDMQENRVYSPRVLTSEKRQSLVKLIS